MMDLTRALLIWGVCLMLPLLVGVLAAQFCLTAPGRRAERARLFLDLLETAIASGQSPERAIAEISESRERIVSVHFHLLAAHLEEGLPFARALDRAPHLLPAGVREVVKMGVEENALPRLLPAARAMLADVNSRMRGAFNYVLVLLVVMAPAALFLLPMISFFVWPRLRQVIELMEVPMPALPAMIFENLQVSAAGQAALALGMLAIAVVYVGGPRLRGWLPEAFQAVLDRVVLWLPWRRRRAQRDFTGVLATLLDAGVPEDRAVALAARGTANAVFARRAEGVLADLRRGVALPLALEGIEKDREFQWRWRNALRAGEGFFAALRGWHEALEARAFQQEQAAAHAITSVIVVVNGLMVALIAAAVFLMILSVMEEAVLW